MGPLIYIAVGEHSGDVLGSRLMMALREIRPDLCFAGIGGPRMTELGFETLFPMNDLAVMGFVEVLPAIWKLSRRMSETVSDIKAKAPQIVVTIDSPGFMLRLLRRISNVNVKRAHYVAPQVWAWREQRVKKFPGLWDTLLCLLPFEPAWFHDHSVPAVFVGHPVLQSGADDGDPERFRARFNVSPLATIIIFMPGSRPSEVRTLLPIFEATLALLREHAPEIVAVIPSALTVAGEIMDAVANWQTKPIIVTDISEKHDAFAAASAALTKSGTSTLELALAGVPMAVTYRVSPISAWFARRMIRVPYVAMINILAGRALVPELLQGACSPSILAQTLLGLLGNQKLADAQRTGFRETLKQLKPRSGDPAAAAAREILALLDQTDDTGMFI